MKVVTTTALLASLWSPAGALSEDWFDNAMKQSFPDVQSVMSVVLTKPDPCQVAVRSLVSKLEEDDMFEEMFESIFPNYACRGQIMFTKAEEEECMAVQSSPEVDEMIKKGVDQPQLVCGWRKFWMAAKDEANVSDSCELCERTVQMIEDSFEKQELAVDIIQEALKVLCQYLPEGSQCKTLLNRFDDIIKWVKQGLSPHNICQKITMCTSKALLPQPAPTNALRGSNDEELCEICRDNTNAMKTLVGVPHGLDLYKDGLESVCALAPESKTCTFMSRHFHKLASHLKRGDDVESTCKAAHACRPATPMKSGPTYLSCVFCEFVGEIVTSALHQGGTQVLPTVKMDVEALCNNLPASAQCQRMSDKFYEFADLMAKGKTPQAGCEAVQMCSPLSVEQNDDSRVANVLAVLDKLVVSLDKPYDLTHYIGCTTCEHTAYAIEHVEKTHNESLPILKKTLKDLCHFLPPCTECRSISAKFDDLVKLINEGLYAKQACVKLGFCKPEESSLASPYMLQLESQVKALMNTKQMPKKDEIGCIFCQYTGEMITQVSRYSKDVVPLLKVGLETLCTRLPKEAKCLDVVESFDVLAQLIEAGKSSLEACQNVQLCDTKVSGALIANNPSTTEIMAPIPTSKAISAVTSTEIVKKSLKKIQKVLTSTKSDDITCEFCEATAESIAAILKYNKELVPAFKIGLEILCDRFQTPQCVNVMPEFDHLVELIESGKNFLEACESAKLCSSLDSPFKTNSLAVESVNKLESQVKQWMNQHVPTESSDVISCMLCEYTGLLIDQVSHYDKDIVPFLKQGIEVLCEKLPVKEECQEVVSHFDAIAELIESGTVAIDACSKVHLCGAPKALEQKKVISSEATKFVNYQLAQFEAKITTMTHFSTENDLLTCLFCEDAAVLIRTVAQYDKDVVPFLKNGLEVVCSQAKQFEQQCNAVVAKFDSLAELIEAGTDPTKACSSVHLCELALKPIMQLENHVANLIAHPEIVSSDEGCLFCQYVSESIEAIIKVDKSRLPLVREAIGAMCSFLPPIVHCDDINEHFDDLAKSIERGDSALNACHHIALCDAPSSALLIPNSESEDASVMKIQTVIDELVANQ